MPDEPIALRSAVNCGRFRLDPLRRELRDSHGCPVPLRAKTFDVLSLLVRRRGRLVSRAEILDAVWSDLHVTEDSVTQCIVEIRRALGAGSGFTLRTIRGHGYMLEATQAASPALGLAVLPFQVLSRGVPDGLGEAVSRDLLVDLAGRPWLRVMACWAPWAGNDTAPAPAGPPPDMRLEGSVTRCDRRFRVAAALIAPATGALVWGWRWSGEAYGDDLVSLQGAIQRGLSAGLLPALDAMAETSFGTESVAA